MKTKFGKKTAGFSMVELMIASAIGCTVCAAAVWFLVEGTRISLKTTASSTNDLAEWGIFSSMTIDSKIANGMVMYPDFIKDTVSNPINQLDDKNPAQNVGNVLILTKSHSQVNVPNQKVIKTPIYDQITGYVFDPTYGTLKTFTYATSDSEKADGVSVETILKNNFDKFVMRTIGTNLSASSFGASGKAFLCRSKNNRSAVLNVEVANGNANMSIGKRKLIEATFYVRG